MILSPVAEVGKFRISRSRRLVLALYLVTGGAEKPRDSHLVAPVFARAACVKAAVG